MIFGCEGSEASSSNSGSSFRFGVALGGAIVAVPCYSVEYFAPSELERVLRGLEPPLLLFEAPRGGNKHFTGVQLLRVPVRRYVVRTIILDRICLFGLIIRIAVVRQRFACSSAGSV